MGHAHQGLVDETCCEWMRCAKVQHIPNLSRQAFEPHAGACDGQSARQRKMRARHSLMAVRETCEKMWLLKSL